MCSLKQGCADEESSCPLPHNLAANTHLRHHQLHMCLMLWHHPRFCVGAALAMAEMKVFLAVLLRDYDFTADNNTTWRQAVGSVPDNGLPLSLTPLASA